MKRIAIHSVPRSGSTWLGEIINSNPHVKYCFQPLFSHKYKDTLNEDSSKQDIEKFFELLIESDDDFVCQNHERILGTLPNFKKSNILTHTVYKEVRYHNILKNLLEKDNELKLILLVRNPVEVMNSWVDTPKEFNPSWNIEEQIIGGDLKNVGKNENFYGLDAWIKTTRQFEMLSKVFSSRVHLVNYSTLKKDSINIVKQLFNFCNLEFSNSTSIFLEDSLNRNVSGSYSVFRGRKTKKLILDERIIELITRYVDEAGLIKYINGDDLK